MKPSKKGYTGPRLAADAGLNRAAALLRVTERALRNAAGRSTNAVFAAQDGAFQAACEQARIPATPRQASKFRRKAGAAWSAHLSLRNSANAA